MKELDTWDAMQMAFEYYKRDSITVLELNQWTTKYQEEHPDDYVWISRDDIAHEHGCNRIWWEIRTDATDLIHRQIIVNCPCCNREVFKFAHSPNPYVKVLKMTEKLKEHGIHSNT